MHMCVNAAGLMHMCVNAAGLMHTCVNAAGLMHMCELGWLHAHVWERVLCQVDMTCDRLTRLVVVTPTVQLDCKSSCYRQACSCPQTKASCALSYVLRGTD
eukprot:362100-Chlamydomonas_euryale.AAC.2